MSDSDKHCSLKAMVDRFLSWPLPASVCSDTCVTNYNYPYPRCGTNLLTADEAYQMLQHVAVPALDAMQAKIDRLMLEYCPDEMTPEQIAEWGRHQKPVPDAEAAMIRATEARRIEHVWAVENKTSFALFDSEEGARGYVSSFPTSVSGGMAIAKLAVIGLPK